MSSFLNVGIIQMPISLDTAENLRYITEKVEALMSGYHKPELIVGVEGGIGYFTPQSIPGSITDYLCALAKKHEIYFIPGTMYESHPDCPEGFFYNAAPIINPKGEIVDVYRKMAPWMPSESTTHPGKNYVVFDIPEKNTKVGVLICYDSNFPEVTRNLTLMGAEVLVKLTQDPEELIDLNRHVHYTRALENQAFFVSTNVVGSFFGSTCYGKSQAINPEGQLMWEAGHNPTTCTLTLDLGLVKRVRKYGTIFMDHYLQQLRECHFPMPYADDVSKAPLYQSDIPEVPKNPAEYEERVKQAGVCTIGKMNHGDIDLGEYERLLNEFFDKKGVYVYE